MPRRHDSGHSGHGGASQRQLKVAETVRRALSDILLRGDAHDPELSRHSITVGEVRATPDLRRMTVYVLPLGGRGAQEALAALRRAAGPLRRLVAQTVRLKYAPELHFVLDESFDRMDATRRLLDDERVRRDLGHDQDHDQDQDPEEPDEPDDADPDRPPRDAD